ncbi:MAG: hypothetical protein AVDCRST_MAG65-1049 [uncultured Solirubrobacteraceae bacterium]|uniref:Uncharacterized protein n=1 Tax=uncultured Solirubrobacteraceae bacterium TaxID=1162706 RepID=A0A6J4RQD9_9ACTN|nr:MAG: hypothetical protein AVDCRST_MAG65-1049 [uncultured Solirubrobacteraceae bacterium]
MLPVLAALRALPGPVRGGAGTEARRPRPRRADPRRVTRPAAPRRRRVGARGSRPPAGGHEPRGGPRGE